MSQQFKEMGSGHGCEQGSCDFCARGLLSYGFTAMLFSC